MLITSHQKCRLTHQVPTSHLTILYHSTSKPHGQQYMLHVTQMSPKKELLIAWFLRELSKVAKQLKACAWNEKHQVAYPWLTRACAAHLDPVFTLLQDMSTCCVNQDILAAGRNSHTRNMIQSCSSWPMLSHELRKAHCPTPSPNSREHQPHTTTSEMIWKGLHYNQILQRTTEAMSVHILYANFTCPLRENKGRTRGCYNIP